MASKFREEERRRLMVVIEEWNLNRLDLFALSEPNENLEFFGVMRFFYQDEGLKVSTKCIRVSSTATTGDVIEILVEKFRPDLRMLSRAAYSLLEVHVNGDERRLMEQERPLLVQLNWGKDDREGRFLLRREVERSSSSLGRLSSSTSELSTTSAKSGSGSFKRKTSKREKKEFKKKEKEEKLKQLASRGSEVEGHPEGNPGNGGVAEKLYSELPESGFTRSISNPELVMRRKRQLKLERKLQEMNSPNGMQGGTLKIYGQSIKPDIPYKTLLLSVNDTVAQVVVEALEKYGYEREDPDLFCLVLVMIPPDGSDNNKEVIERLMDDNECPLNLLLQHPPSKGLIKFHLRLRPPDAPAKHRPADQRINNKSFESNYSLDSWNNNNNYNMDLQQEQQQLSFLQPIGPDGRDMMNADRISIPYGMLDVGRERTHPSNVPYLCLAAPDILPQHCSITRSAGGVTWIAPTNHDAAVVFIQNQRIREPTQIYNGQVVQIGKSYFFRYLDNNINSKVPSSIQNSNYVNKHPHSNNNNQLRSPSSSSSSRASTARPSKDFETTFDLDGQVLTVPSHVTGPIINKNMSLSEDSYNKMAYNASAKQQRVKSGLGQPENLLPANFTFLEGCEDRFLRECVTDVNFAVMQFKMSPSFLIYLSTQSMLRSSSSPPNGDMRIPNFTHKMAQLVAKTVKENTGNPPLLSFWLANSSELKNFFQCDARLSSSTEQAQRILTDVIQVAFSSFIECLKGELEQTLPAIIGMGPEAGDMEAIEDFVIKRLQPKLGNVTHVLTLAMSVLRRCRVNTTITIFIFSQLFLFISSWVFNCVVLDPRLRLCTSDWGRRLRLRLQQIMMWSEKQGLEKAAECHLAKVMQLCLILECKKSDLLQILPKCDLINSIQLQAILNNFIYSPEEQPLTQDHMDRVLRIVASTVDCDIIGEGGKPQLQEPLDQFFLVSQVFPREGFSCDSVVGVPPGMLDFIDGFIRSGVGAFSLNPHSSGSWSVYLDNTFEEEGSLEIMPEIIQVTLTKVRNSLGLSIVAAQGEGQKDKGIYVKSVVPSGAADLDGRIHTGDQLIEVGGRSLIGVTQEKAAEMMSQSGQVVNLKVLKRAATYHGLSAILEAATQDASQKMQRKMPIQNDGRSRVQDSVQSSNETPSPSLIGKQVVYPDNSRSQSSLPWRQEGSLSSLGKDDLYVKQPYNINPSVQPPRSNIPFSTGMASSHSDPNLINPDNSYPIAPVGHQIKSGPKKFNGVSGFEGTSELKYANHSVADQLRSSSLTQGTNYPLGSSSMDVYQGNQDAKYASLNPNIQNQLASNGRQDPRLIYGRLDSGRNNSPIPSSIQFSDAPPIKLNPALPASKPPRPTSAIIPLNKGPGYATQMLFPKVSSAAPHVQQAPNVRASPAFFSQSSSVPPTSLTSNSQNKAFMPSMSSNADYLISSANQSSEVYQVRTQVLPKNQLNSSGEFDFPPPPPDVQLAQLKISGITPGQPRPSENLHSNPFEGNQTKSNQNVNASDLANQKKPPPVAIKPKITSADLKSVSLSKSPWEKEAREKEEEDMMKRRRMDEIRRLENKPYLSQEEQSKLKRLQTEEEFDQRALLASQESQDADTPTRSFPPSLGVVNYQEQTNNYTSERQLPITYGQMRMNQSQYASRGQPTSPSNPIGYGQQEELYGSREEMQVAPQIKQMPKITGGPALKQFQQSDNLSQSSLSTTTSSGMMKKTVTFNENVGVNEYPVLRSYGSTSSDGSLVQSFDQSFSGSYSDDQSPNSSFQRGAVQPTFLPKLVDQERAMYGIPTSQVSYEYKPKFIPEPVYTSKTSNLPPSYPYRPPQPSTLLQNQQQAPSAYPYRPATEVSNPRNQPVYGRRVMDPTYTQRVSRTGSPSVQENVYTSRNKALYGTRDANYSYE